MVVHTARWHASVQASTELVPHTVTQVLGVASCRNEGGGQAFASVKTARRAVSSVGQCEAVESRQQAAQRHNCRLTLARLPIRRMSRWDVQTRSHTKLGSATAVSSSLQMTCSNG